MLLVKCANGWVVWIFRRTTNSTSAARCMLDGFKVAYSPTPDQTWQDLAAVVVQHSVGLKGAFQDMYFWPLR